MPLVDFTASRRKLVIVKLTADDTCAIETLAGCVLRIFTRPERTDRRLAALEKPQPAKGEGAPKPERPPLSSHIIDRDFDRWD
ncbi:MAG: hypothetical protein J2P48_14485 [Alphaproteobacteria bacterium]|nr:hypothetical protein [Alphaproteobacteria bacterium]